MGRIYLPMMEVEQLEITLHSTKDDQLATYYYEMRKLIPITKLRKEVALTTH
jgi:hypothetical protein